MTSNSARVDCIILGGGGHAAVVLDALEASSPGYRLGILDPDETKWDQEVFGVPVLGGDERLPELIEKGAKRFVVGLGGTGDNRPRKRLFEMGLVQGLRPLTVIHPSAVCSRWAEVGAGSVILPGAVVNARAFLGVNVIVNSGAVVEHDCRIGDHVHVATGARLAASVRVEACAHLGVGSVVRQGVVIGERAVVGAGAAVVRDVAAGVTVIGIPARPMNGRGVSN